MSAKSKQLYLYDPRANVLTETDYSYVSELTGMSRNSLASGKSRKRIIKSINCYLVDDRMTLKERKSMYEKELFEDEIWTTVEGSGGIFLISNQGRFKRIYKQREPGFILPYIRKQNNHLYVKAIFNGKYKECKVSHLVTHHFIGPNKNKLSVRHKNGIKIDCFAGNLEYMSKQRLGRLTGYSSKSKPVVQLDPETSMPIEEFRSAREAGRQMFMSYQTVLDNCNGKTELAVGEYKFMFLDEYEEWLG